MSSKAESVHDVKKGLQKKGYICSEEIATAVYLAIKMQKPILVEGPAGVGKTELARMISKYLKLKLIRLQCYEGLDETKAIYEWEYAKQLLYTQMLKDKINDIIAPSQSLKQAVEVISSQEDAFFSERFILPRPLLQAISSEKTVVLLIDEVDKSDPEFEAYLLEILSDFQISIPELGTRKAKNIPIVLLTSNNSRDLSDALKRRCLHLYIDYPPPELEATIVKSKFPKVSKKLLSSLINAVQQIRELDIKKKPAISETIDWAEALITLQIEELTPEDLHRTLGMLSKHKTDTEQILAKAKSILGDKA